ncbi:protein DpdD [Vibrio fortis]|uniref:protein DpdD n=1 Tax=Vibrio fortis TaxID=212667 RepID=UPI002F3ED310
MTVRRIFKSRTSRQSEILDVLSSLFVTEVIQPSDTLWLVSPWVTDLELLDNRTGNFDYLEPAWGQRMVQITELLTRMMANGGRLNLVTNFDTHNDRFLRQLQERVENYGVKDRLKIVRKKQLHTKGILGRSFYLHGSMNLTRGGVEFNDEQINLDIDKQAIADAELHFMKAYGDDINELDKGELTWYALTDTESAQVELGELLTAHVGCSYTGFVNQPYHLDPNDPTELALLEAYTGLGSVKVFRFTAREGYVDQVFDALERLRIQLVNRPARRLNVVRHRGRILRDIHFALYRQNGADAYQHLAELRRAGGIGDQNELFLELRCLAVDGQWDKIINHPKLHIAMELPRPRVLTEALMEAVYGYQLLALEMQQDLVGQRQLFDSTLISPYRSLFITLQKVTSPNAVKAALLWLLSDSKGDTVVKLRRAEKLAKGAQCYTDNDRFWIDQLLAQFSQSDTLDTEVVEPEPTPTPVLTPAAAPTSAPTLSEFQQFSLLADEDPQAVLDELVEGRWNGVSAHRVAAVALKCASYLVSPESAQQADNLLKALDDETREQLLSKPVYAKLYADISPTLRSKSDEITTWHDWLTQLIADPDWLGARTLAEEGAQHWPSDAMNFEQFAGMIEDCAGSDDQRAAQALREHLTSLATWLFNCEPTSQLQPVWMALIELLALDQNTSQEDMIFATDLTRGCLQGTLSSSQYSDLLEYMGLLQGACGSGASVADIWLDMLELLFINPCPKPEQRDELFLLVYNSFAKSPMRYTHLQWQALTRLFGEVGMSLTIPEMVQSQKQDDTSDKAKVDLNGKRVALYTLTESVSHRVRDRLLELFPDADVRVNSDKVATEALKVLARESDYFVFAWLSSAHQAFYSIKAERKGKPLLQPKGKGSSSMLRCLVDM